MADESEKCRVRARINLMTPAGQVAEGGFVTLGRADAEMMAASGAVTILENSEGAAKRGRGAKP